MKQIVIIIGMLLICTTTMFADLTYGYDSDQFHVESYTDGNGLFQYSFTSENYLKLSYVRIELDTTLIDSIESPGDWFPVVDIFNPDHIIWSSEHGQYLNTTPLTFSIQYAVSESVIATDGSAGGVRWGDDVPMGIVYQNDFSYIQPIPEPSSVILLLVGAVGVWTLRKRKNR